MGSVIDEVKCNFCGGIKNTDYRYRTGEETQFCQKCGYFYEREVKVNEAGDTILNAKGNFQYNITEEFNNGVISIADEQGTTLYAISNDISENDLFELINKLNANSSIDREESYIYYFDRKTNTGKCIWGNEKAIPEFYDEPGYSTYVDDKVDELKISAVKQTLALKYLEDPTQFDDVIEEINDVLNFTEIYIENNLAAKYNVSLLELFDLYDHIDKTPDEISETISEMITNDFMNKNLCKQLFDENAYKVAILIELYDLENSKDVFDLMLNVLNN